MSLSGMAVHPIDRDIANSLNSLHAQIFTSIHGDENELSNFLLSWKSFEDLFLKNVDSVTEDTLQRVYNFSSLVASMTQGVTTTMSLCDDASHEVQSILDNATPGLPHEKEPGTGSQASYLRLASEWLVSNIHDPYPSQEVRKYMATHTNSLKKDIDNWFLDARRRVGWNDMRRKHFDNKRVKIVDAAKRFFLNTDPSQPLPQVVESEFARMQLRTQELHSEKFEESPLAVQLDRSIIDLTPHIKASLRATKSRKARASSNTKAARNYPTPQPSPSGASSPLALSPTPSLSELPSTASKRRTSPPSEFENQGKRPVKRRRTSEVVNELSLISSPTPSFSELPSTTSKGTATTSPGFDEGDECLLNSRRPFMLVRETSPSLQIQRAVTFAPPETSLPSPVASTCDAFELHPPPHYTDHDATSTIKRKRRPSDSEEGLPDSKRPQTSSIASLTQAAACLLPVTQHATADGLRWDRLLDFSQLAPPVGDLTAEITGPVDVSLFDFSAWDDYEYDTSSLSQGSIATVTSSNTVDTDVTSRFAAQSTDLLANDNLLFDWSPYGSSYSPTQQSPTSGNGFLNCVPCDLTSLGNQLTTSTPLYAGYGCLQTFSLPFQPTLQNVAQPAEEAARTIPKSTLKAKEEQLHALQAQVAALTAEIAAAS